MMGRMPGPAVNPCTTVAGARACHQLPLSALLSRSPFSRAWLPRTSVARTRGPCRPQCHVCLRCATLGLYVHVTRAPPQHPALTILPPREHPPPTACLPHNWKSAPWNLPTPARLCMSDAVGWEPRRPHLEECVPREHGTRSHHSPYRPDVSGSRVSARTTPRGLPWAALRAENRLKCCGGSGSQTQQWAKSRSFGMPDAGAEGPGRQSPE